ncbi:MAG: hypothetical protein WBZ37_30885 [Mycobacterium sp.]
MGQLEGAGDDALAIRFFPITYPIHAFSVGVQDVFINAFNT